MTECAGPRLLRSPLARSPHVPVLFLVAGILASSSALAQNVTLEHSGYLLGADDATVTTPVDFGFALFDAANAGTPGWSSGTCSLTVDAGYYAVTLGAGSEGCGAAI